MDSLDSMLVTQLLERVEKLEKLALDNKRRDSVEIGTPAKGKRVLAEAQGGQ